MNEKEWLQKRRNYICSTDISAICGLNPYKSSFDVWDEKVNGTIVNLDDKPAVKWGSLLEPLIAESFAKRHNVEILKGDFISNFYAANGNHASSFDYLFADVSKKTVLECKTAGMRTAHLWGPSGSDRVLDQYYLQCQWQMYVIGYDKCWLALLLGGQEEREYFIERDDNIINKLIARANDFWDKYVLTKELPPPSGHRKENEYLNKTLVSKDKEIIDANAKQIEMIIAYRVNKMMLEEKQKEKLELEAKIKLEIGEHGGIRTFGEQVTWFANKKGVRSFRYKELG